MVIFRENTEDIYAGIEFEAGTEENRKFLELFKQHFPKAYGKIRFPASSGIGIKPVSKEGSERLIRAAIEYAVANKRRNVTLVHKGNIQKFTEGAFRNWGYQLAEREFPGATYTWEQWERTKAASGESRSYITVPLQGYFIKGSRPCLAPIGPFANDTQAGPAQNAPSNYSVSATGTSAV